MSGAGKKTTGRRGKMSESTTKEATAASGSAEQQPSAQPPVQDAQGVKDWSRVDEEEEEVIDTGSEEPKPRRQSAFNFDRQEVGKLCDRKVSELNLEQLLQYTIRMGEEQKNPVVVQGCGRVLKMINGERMGGRHFEPRFNGPRRDFVPRNEADRAEVGGPTGNDEDQSTVSAGPSGYRGDDRSGGYRRGGGGGGYRGRYRDEGYRGGNNSNREGGYREAGGYRGGVPADREAGSETGMNRGSRGGGGGAYNREGGSGYRNRGGGGGYRPGRGESRPSTGGRPEPTANHDV